MTDVPPGPDEYEPVWESFSEDLRRDLLAWIAAQRGPILGMPTDLTRRIGATDPPSWIMWTDSTHGADPTTGFVALLRRKLAERDR